MASKWRKSGEKWRKTLKKSFNSASPSPPSHISSYCSYTLFLLFLSLCSLYILPYVYCICRVVGRVVGKVEKPLILNGFSVFEVRIAASLFKRMSFVIWLLFLLRFYHRKVCSEYAVTKCRTCSNHCVKMSHKQ